jgi:hypothetical protein
MNTLPTTSLLVTLAYVGYIIYKFKGIPSSISESFYLLGEDEEARLAFDAWTILAGAPIMYYMMDHSSGYLRALSFLTGMGLMIVGYAPRFKWKLERPIHFGATALAAGCSMVWAYKTGGSLLQMLSLMLIALAVGSQIKGVSKSEGKRDTKMFFAEIAAFANLYINTLVKKQKA